MRIYLLGSEEYAVNQVQFIHTVLYNCHVLLFGRTHIIKYVETKQSHLEKIRLSTQKCTIKYDVRGWYSLNSSNSGFLFALLHFWLKKGGEGPSFWRNQSKQKE